MSLRKEFQFLSTIGLFFFSGGNGKRQGFLSTPDSRWTPGAQLMRKRVDPMWARMSLCWGRLPVRPAFLPSSALPSAAVSITSGMLCPSEHFGPLYGPSFSINPSCSLLSSPLSEETGFDNHFKCLSKSLYPRHPLIISFLYLEASPSQERLERSSQTLIAAGSRHIKDLTVIVVGCRNVPL